MSDKMRELFEKWAKAECLDLDSVDGFYSDNDTHIAWGAWQAAQTAAVPEHIRSIKIPTDAMEQEFQKHYRRGYEAGKGDAVPVVGEAEALICDDCGAETNDPWHSSKGTNRHYHRCDSCNSIAAAELDALRKDAERYRWIRHGDNDERCIHFTNDSPAGTDTVWIYRESELDKIIDAAIAGEKKDKENA